ILLTTRHRHCYRYLPEDFFHYQERCPVFTPTCFQEMVMKKLIAVALSSTALLASPAIFAQTTAPASTGGQGTGVGNENAPLTPSQTQTSEGAVYNPPPIDRSGNAKHLTDKGMTGKDGDSGSMGTDSGNNG